MYRDRELKVLSFYVFYSEFVSKLWVIVKVRWLCQFSDGIDNVSSAYFGRLKWSKILQGGTSLWSGSS